MAPAAVSSSRSTSRGTRPCRAGRWMAPNPAMAPASTNTGQTCGRPSEALTSRPSEQPSWPVSARRTRRRRSAASASAPPRKASDRIAAIWTTPISPTASDDPSAGRPGRGRRRTSPSTPGTTRSAPTVSSRYSRCRRSGRRSGTTACHRRQAVALGWRVGAASGGAGASRSSGSGIDRGYGSGTGAVERFVGIPGLTSVSVRRLPGDAFRRRVIAQGAVEGAIAEDEHAAVGGGEGIAVAVRRRRPRPARSAGPGGTAPRNGASKPNTPPSAAASQ